MNWILITYFIGIPLVIIADIISCSILRKDYRSNDLMTSILACWLSWLAIMAIIVYTVNQTNRVLIKFRKHD